MTLENKIKDFTDSIDDKLAHIDTEETTKIALILPFLRLLGYDTTNPGEVRAEYTADIGGKKGEKIDLAILDDGKPVVFIECKTVNDKLNDAHTSQLYRYFSITDVKIGILTNGIKYKFFTSSVDNRMDEKSFLDIDLRNMTKKDLKELEKFVKNNLNIDEVINRAESLKYKNEIKKCLLKELEHPSDDFIKVIGKQVYDGILTPNMKEKFGKIIVSVNSEIINDMVDKRLKEAVEQAPDNDEEIDEVQIEEKDHIDISQEEYDGFDILRAIVSDLIPADRIAMRKRKKYLTILLDDNQNYPVCRLHFNNSKNLKLELFDSFKKS